ncbi:MAG: hypothetical protein Q8L01_03165, partial [Candidatus Woesebacteria bacterium]|nr:hypothetical protein [Candidatus Woesebacteria bacterium]
SLILIGLGCKTEEGEEVDYQDDVYPLIEEVDSSAKVRGSCNIIESSSTCVDYIGSIWTEQQMKLNCQGVGAFSLDACPYPDFGGCANTPETISENIIWFYPYGGEAFTAEEIVYAQMACNALDISKWTTPDALFLGE